MVLKQQRDFEGNMLRYLLTELDNLAPASEGPDRLSPTSKVGDLLGLILQLPPVVSAGMAPLISFLYFPVKHFWGGMGGGRP